MAAVRIRLPMMPEQKPFKMANGSVWIFIYVKTPHLPHISAEFKTFQFSNYSILYSKSYSLSEVPSFVSYFCNLFFGAYYMFLYDCIQR